MSIKNLVFIILIVVYHVVCLDFLAKFHQSDFKLRDMRSEVTFFNKNMLHEFNIIGHKYNRTTTAFNFTVRPKIDMGENIEVIVQGLKRASNEYRLFPLRFQMNYCKGIQSNVLGAGSLANLGNYSTCLWKKDKFYAAYNFVIDESFLPPYLPHGEYLALSEYYVYSDKLAIVNCYAEVYSAATAKRGK